MSNAAENKLHRASPELVAVLSLGVMILVAVLGQAAWLDGKIERVDAKLTAQIDSLHEGQTAIRERLAALEARVGAVEARLGVVGATVAGEPSGSAF